MKKKNDLKKLVAMRLRQSVRDLLVQLSLRTGKSQAQLVEEAIRLNANILKRS